MDLSTARWFADPGMIDDPSFHQWELGSLDQLTAPNFWEDIEQSLSSESYKKNNNSFNNPNSRITSNTFSGGSSMDSSQHRERPRKMVKTAVDPKSTIEPKTSSSPSILSFGNPDSPSDHPDFYKSLVSVVLPKQEIGVITTAAGSKRRYDGAAKKAAATTTRPPSHNQDHIIAERKRREKLSQKFIALSAIVPGLKKMDKASVLGNAIKYLKQLQEKVKTLEEQQSAQKPVESAGLVKKSQLSEDDVSSCDENFEGGKSEDVNVDNRPEIEAKLSEKMVLIKIHCKKHKGVLVKALAEIESFNLSVLNTSAIPFASSALDITVMAQIEEGFSLTVKELVTKLKTAFRQFK